MRYLITVSAAARRLSPGTFAAESGFVHHLRDLRRELAGRFTEIVVAMPSMRDADWEAQREMCETIDETAENIRLETLHERGCSRLQFWWSARRLYRQIGELVQRADLVHTDFAYDIFRPTGAWFCSHAARLGKRIIAVEDIDRRRDPEMNYKTGNWSLRQYLACRYLWDPIRDRLMRRYVRDADLMLFKEAAQVSDYGRGAPHVRLFLDPHYAASDVVDDQFVARKMATLEDERRPLRLTYFGRLVPYKGVDKMIQAVASAYHRGANLTFDIMGCGDKTRLQQMIDDLGIHEIVNWLAPRPYGAEFFEVLRERDVLLACPLSSDTPRSAWDALASGMPLVAFDSPFYKSMAELSHAVVLSPWPEVEPLADQLLKLAADKHQLAPMVAAGVQTARANTGDMWLRRRIDWVVELMGDAIPALPKPGEVAPQIAPTPVAAVPSGR